MRHLLVLLLAFLLSGCRALTGCDSKTQTFEAIYGDPFYQVTLDLVHGSERVGYSCPSTAIRNVLGTQIGDKYVCTICN